MKKTIVTTLLALNILTSACNVEAKTTTRFVKTENLTCEMLETRNNKIQIVEVLKGKCTNAKKDGKLTVKSPYNYISYRGVKGCHKGDTVTTYEYFDKHCTFTDCIVKRIDVVNCKHKHKTYKTVRKFESCK